MISQRRSASQHKFRQEIEAVIRDSSEKVRTFLLSYLLIVIYVLAVVSSTTDVQLLVPSRGLKLPFADVSVPLVGFYLVVPFIILALHANLLLSVALHHGKLVAWRRTFDGNVPAERIGPHIFDFAALGSRTSPLGVWVLAASELLFFISGPVVILIVLWRIADYQSAGLLCANIVAFGADIGFVSLAKSTMRTEQVRGWTFFRSAKEFALAPVRLVTRSLSGWLWRVFFLVAAAKVLVCVDTFIVPWEHSFLRKVAPSALHELDNMDRPSSLFGFVPRIVVDRNERLFEADANALRNRAEIAGRGDWRHEFETRYVTLDLRGRSLRYLSLSSQVLPRVWAHDAQFQGADFFASSMNGSVFVGAQMQSARLTMGEFEGSIFLDTNLRSASLSQARLGGSMFDRTQLQGASLAGAILAGAQFFDTDFRGAVLEGARFDGALVDSMQLWGVIGNVPPAVVVPVGASRSPVLDRTQPSSAESKRWAAARLGAAGQRRLEEYFSSPGTTVALEFQTDVPRSAVAVSAAACRLDDRFWLSTYAVRQLHSVATLLAPEFDRVLKSKVGAESACPPQIRSIFLSQ